LIQRHKAEIESLQRHYKQTKEKAKTYEKEVKQLRQMAQEPKPNNDEVLALQEKYQLEK